jgi:hypothetical protein
MQRDQPPVLLRVARRQISLLCRAHSQGIIALTSRVRHSAGLPPSVPPAQSRRSPIRAEVPRGPPGRETLRRAGNEPPVPGPREPRRPCALAGALTSTIPSTRPLSPQHPGHSHDKKQAVTAQHTPTRHGPSPSGRPMPHRSHLIDQLPLVGQVILCWPGVLSASSQRVGGIGWFERMMSPGSTAALMRRRQS